MRLVSARGLAVAFTVAFVAGLAPSVASAYINWPGYLFNLSHSSLNAAATAIAPAQATALTPAWSKAFKPPAHSGRSAPLVYGSPTVYNGSVYVGAQDGYFYRLSETTGAVLNAIDTGWEQACSANTQKIGITATATVAADPARGTSARTVYISGGTPAGGSGGIYLWALDATTFQKVWATDPVRVDTQVGSLAWSSPAVSGGRIYVGISSQCDNPLVRGGLAIFNQSDGSAVGTYHGVPSGSVGAGVWSTAAVSGTTSWLTTGNADETNPSAIVGDSYSMVRLNGTSKVDKWTVPGAFTAKNDDDWGSSPTLFTGLVNGTGTALVGGCNKNGVYYALKQYALSAGPVWSFRIGAPTSYPPFDGCLSGAVWDSTGHQLIVGGNKTSANIDGQAWPGSIRALSPDAGAAKRVLWDNGLPCLVIGTPTENSAGVVAVVTWNTCRTGSAPALYLFDGRHPKPNSAGGNPDAPLLKTIPLAGSAFSQPTFADNYLFVASESGGLMAYH